jgi:Spy/CpxP family protein refolding chaperone
MLCFMIAYGLPSYVTKRLTTGLWCLLALAITLFGNQAWAKPHRIDWSPLKLSPEQHSLFVDVERDWQATYEALHPELLRIKGQLRYLMEQPTSDEGELKRLHDRATAIESQLRQKATECFLRKKRALTPEQRQHLVEQLRQHER